MPSKIKARTLFAGAAVAVLTLAGAALAAPPPPPPEVGPPPEGRHMHPPRIDTNADGYISRDEARTAAEELFDRLDRNHDGKLNASDRSPHGMFIEKHVEIERRGDVQRRTETVRTRDGEGEDHGDHLRHHMHPPGGPPMMMLWFSGLQEAEAAAGGALSKEAFVAYALRYFDAADVNRDGRIKEEIPPPPLGPNGPPEPPTPPAPAEPPSR